ncbi:MAG: nuclear transport factor 2 family protein [Proteobacteria bacterium]|nr:nuclear transport factor 2 family protein [Pseudomonadota bacterium]
MSEAPRNRAQIGQMGRSDEVHVWLETFARCVRERDVEAGRRLFDAAARGFGTRAPVVDSLEDLIRLQWSPTWPRTQGFAIEAGSVRQFAAGDGTQIAVTACWRSEGVDTPADWGRQTPYLRRGRCTLVLQRQADGQLRAVHSHYSMNPDRPMPDPRLSSKTSSA